MLSRELLTPEPGAMHRPGAGGLGLSGMPAKKDPAPASWLDELPLTLQWKCHFFQEAPPDSCPMCCLHSPLMVAPAPLSNTLCSYVNCAAPTCRMTRELPGDEGLCLFGVITPIPEPNTWEGSIGIDGLAVDNHPCRRQLEKLGL